MRRWERLRAFRHQVRATRTGRLALQIAVGIVGIVVIAGGAVLIPLPGPGWLIVLAGLAILSLEFEWAQRLLEFTRDRLERWWHWLGRRHWTVRAVAGLTGLAFAATMMWLSIRYGSAIFS